MATSTRDTRIDVFRALALLTIFVDHVPGTTAEHYTFRNLGFADAAEVFVLISGMAVALAYAPRFASGRSISATLKMWHRAGVLYCAHIMATIGSLTIFCAAALLLNRPELLRLNNIDALIDVSAEALVGVGLMGHQLGYNNILSMYAVVLLGAPLVIWGARRNATLTLLASVLLWLVAGWRQWAPPNYPTEGYWFLNPLSWQLLFVIGIISMMKVREGAKLPRSPWLITLAAAYVVFAFVWIRSPMWGQEGWHGLPLFLAGFDKTFLALPRLLHVLALAYLVAVIPSLNGIARVKPNNPLAVLGRKSLPVFVFGTLLAMLAQVLKATVLHGPVADALLLTIGILLQFGFAYLLIWLSRLARDEPALRRLDRTNVQPEPSARQHLHPATATI